MCAALPATDATLRKLVAIWVLGVVSAALNRTGATLAQVPVQAPQLAGLLRRVADGTLSGRMAKDVFDALWSSGEDRTVVAENTLADAETVDAIIERRGLRQISDERAIEALVDDVIAANSGIVAEFRSGREKAFNSLVGKVMKASKGRANPSQLNAILKRKLGVG